MKEHNYRYFEFLLNRNGYKPNLMKKDVQYEKASSEYIRGVF